MQHPVMGYLLEVNGIEFSGDTCTKKL